MLKKSEKNQTVATVSQWSTSLDACSSACCSAAVYRLLFSAGKVVGELGVGGLFGGQILAVVRASAMVRYSERPRAV